MKAALPLLFVSLAAHAQLSAAGGPSSVAPVSGMAALRWPDVAYDPVNDVYLGVTGAQNIQGQYWSATGVPVGAAFVVNSANIYAQAPRVTYLSAVGGFLVTWHASVTNNATQIRGRIVRYNQAPLTDDFDISSLTTNWEMGATSAYSAQSREALAAWQGANTSLKAQRISDTGAKVGAEIDVEPSARYHRDPAVAYSSTVDEFLVAYAGCVANDDCFVEAQRVKAGTGALLGSPIVLDANVTAGYVPEAAFNAITRQWLVVWHRRTASSAAFYSRRIREDGTLAAPAQLVTNTFGSYDANGIAWNPVTNTFVFVSHGTGAEDLALELDANGAPIGAAVSVGDAAATGNFNPRICANTESAEWLAITSAQFANLTTHRLTSLTRDRTGVAPDAGADAGSVEPDGGAGDAGSAPATVDSGTASTDAGSGSSGRAVGTCGCNSSTSASSNALTVLLAAAAAIAMAVAVSRGRR